MSMYLATAVHAFASSGGGGWPSPASVGGSLATDKPPNPNACFRWGTTAELRCLDHLSPFWHGWGFCQQLLTNRTVVGFCDADSIEYPCTYADNKVMKAGQCLLKACEFEIDHTDYDCLGDCPKFPASMYYSPVYPAQCEAFNNPDHPCGKRCFKESRTSFELFKARAARPPPRLAPRCASTRHMHTPEAPLHVHVHVHMHVYMRMHMHPAHAPRPSSPSDRLRHVLQERRQGLRLLLARIRDRRRGRGGQLLPPQGVPQGRRLHIRAGLGRLGRVLPRGREVAAGVRGGGGLRAAG